MARESSKPSSALVPMIGPDGSSRLVPSEQVHELMMRGAVPGVVVRAPNGKLGVVRFEDAESALSSGGTLMQNDGEPYAPGTAPVIVGHNEAGQPIWGTHNDLPAGQRFLHTAKGVLEGAAKGMFDLAPTPQEKAEGLDSWIDYPLRPFERAVEGQVQEGQEARDLMNHKHYMRGVAHGLAALVPLLGPWAAEGSEDFWKHVRNGDYAGALGTVAGNAATAAALELAPKVTAGLGETLQSGLENAASAAKDRIVGPRLDKPMGPGQLTPRERYEAAKEMGVPLDAAQATNAPVLKAVKQVGEHSLTGGGKYEATREAGIEGLHNHAAKVLNDIAPQMDRGEFGAAAQEALRQHQLALNEESGNLYDDLDKRVGAVRPDLSSIREKARDVIADNKDYFEKHPKQLHGATERAWSELNNIAKNKPLKTKEVETGVLGPDGKPITKAVAEKAPDPDTWSDLHKLRTDLMDAYRGPEFVGDRPTGWLKQMVEAIDHTMTNAEGTPGMTDQDRNEFRRANALYQRMKETYDDRSSPFYWLTRQDPTAVADKLHSLATTSPENVFKFRRAMADTGNSSPEGPYGDLSAQLQRQTAERLMNKSGNAAPDLENFPAAWKRADKTKLAETLAPETMRELNNLASVSRTVNWKSNPSGTAVKMQPFMEAGSALSAAGAAVPTAVLGHPEAAVAALAPPALELGAQHLAAKAMNSPAVVDSLLRKTETRGPMETLKDSFKKAMNKKGLISGSVAALPQGPDVDVNSVMSSARNLHADEGGFVGSAPLKRESAVQRPDEVKLPNGNIEGVSTPPNHGDITSVTQPEKNEVHNVAEAAAELKADRAADAAARGETAAPQAVPGSQSGVSRVTNDKGETIYSDPSLGGPQASLQTPAGAVMEHLDEDGNVLGHVMEDGSYRPVAADGS